LWSFGNFLPIFLCCTKKNLATQVRTAVGIQKVLLEKPASGFTPTTFSSFDVALRGAAGLGGGLLLSPDPVSAVDAEEGGAEHDGDADDTGGRDHVAVDDARQQEGDHLGSVLPSIRITQFFAIFANFRRKNGFFFS
jgi:hypothetical protein